MVEAKTNKHIYLVRHGETHENARHVETGQRTYATLSPQGIRDAQSVAAWFQENNSSIPVIWSSPLHRSRMTADHIARSIGASIYNRDELKEADMGAVDGLPRERAEKLYPEYYRKRRLDSHYRAHEPWPNGESYADVQRRIAPVVSELVIVPHDIIVVGHRIVNKLLMGLLTNSLIEEVADYAQKHNEVIEISLPTRAVRSHSA